MADNYNDYSREELIRELRLRDRRPRFGLVWERKEIEHEKAVNEDFVTLEFDPALSCGATPYRNLIIEGDNFDALRYLRMTHHSAEVDAAQTGQAQVITRRGVATVVVLSI